MPSVFYHPTISTINLFVISLCTNWDHRRIFWCDSTMTNVSFDRCPKCISLNRLLSMRWSCLFWRINILSRSIIAEGKRSNLLQMTRHLTIGLFSSTNRKEIAHEGNSLPLLVLSKFTAWERFILSDSKVKIRRSCLPVVSFDQSSSRFRTELVAWVNAESNVCSTSQWKKSSLEHCALRKTADTNLSTLKKIFSSDLAKRNSRRSNRDQMIKAEICSRRQRQTICRDRHVKLFLKMIDEWKTRVIEETQTRKTKRIETEVSWY